MRKAFTLIELLVVIAILAVLAGTIATDVGPIECDQIVQSVLSQATRWTD